METIQVVLGKKLLQAIDRAARQTKQNRSALVREALREYLQKMEMCPLERRDHEGYSRHPATDTESRLWEPEIVWPEAKNGCVPHRK